MKTYESLKDVLNIFLTPPEDDVLKVFRTPLVENVLKVFLATPEEDVVKEIQSFEHLQHGWDFGMGDPIKHEIVKDALKIHEIGVYFNLSTEATAEVNGGITLTFICDKDAVDIRINPDLTYAVTCEKKTGDEFEELLYRKNLNRSAALQYLYELRKDLRVDYRCRSFEGSRQTDTAKRKSNSRKTHVSTIIKMESPSLSSNASWTLVGTCATT